jgi:molecular chaperone GrpE
MAKKVEIPVRNSSSTDLELPSSESAPGVTEVDATITAGKDPGSGEPILDPVTGRPARAPSASRERPEEEGVEEWRDQALRLQAEMQNYRRRQQRLAEERIVEEREHLLRAFLHVADNLERALNANKVSLESLRNGVELTYQTLMQVLDQEGAQPIQAIGQPFDPAWHEAVGTVSHQQAGIEPGTVAVVTQVGYRLGDRLLRPALVIVAD